MAKAPTIEEVELSAEELLAQLAAEQRNAETRELLKRYGLKRAIIENATQVVTFDAPLIEQLLSGDAAAYTLISA